MATMMTPSLQRTPTDVTYISLDEAFAHFNNELFDGELPAILITLQRRKDVRGYFSAAKFARRGSVGNPIDEIALNPATFHGRSDPEILSTLVHEMVHLWQRHRGQPGRGRHHNGEWADRTQAAGLMPTTTGEIGAPRTGDHVTHVIIPGGPFDLACQMLLAGGRRVIWFQDLTDERSERLRKAKAAAHTLFVCPQCREQNVRGRPSTHVVVCGDCGVRLVAG
jgi:predicted SprT family Zn-dependent metalloprotease